MKTLFELKNHLPFDTDLLERLQKAASIMLKSAEQGQYTQGLILISSTEKEYSAVIKDVLSEEHAEEKALLEELKANHDTTIDYILCMWQDGCIDIPSWAFRKMLCSLDPKNADARLFVTTKNGVSVIKLANTMK